MGKLVRATKVGILIPSYDKWDVQFALSLIALLDYHRGDESLDIQLFTRISGILPASRQALVELAVEAGCDWILFLDCDQTFPKDTLARLAGHRNALVAANCPRRDGTSLAVRMSPEAIGLVETGTLPFGVVLIKTEVFDHVARPYFDFEWNSLGNGLGYFTGEDVSFSHKCINAGMKLFIDADLSKEIGHIGRKEWKLADLDKKTSEKQDVICT